jgi:hypothetical protein
MEYRRAFGAYPTMWREYVYALDHLNRASARESIRQASAARIAGATEESSEAWWQRQKIAAGWV